MLARAYPSRAKTVSAPRRIALRLSIHPPRHTTVVVVFTTTVVPYSIITEEPPMSFTAEELAYLASQPLGRLATVAPDGQPDVVPVGFEYDGTYFYVGGVDPGRTRKVLNVRAGHQEV